MALPRRLGWRVLRVALAAYLLILLLMLMFENSLVFFPVKYPGGFWGDSTASVREDAWFTAADGTKLHGWYFLASGQRKATVLFCHGNGGNITHRRDIFAELQARGCDVLAFDYRGYGRSEGSPNESGVLADARAARAWLAHKSGVEETEIVLLGESLGGGVAVQLAAETPARALILENTFSSVPDVAAHHFPWLPVRMLMRNRFDSLAVIGKYHGPLLQFHGDADRTVPYAFGQKLFAAANEPKKFVTIAGGDHNDGPTPEFYAEVSTFLEKLQL